MPLSRRAQSAYDLIDKAIKRQGDALADAVRELRETMGDGDGWPEAINEAVEEFKRRYKEIEVGKKPTTFHRRGRVEWYPGPNEERDRFWPALKHFLLEDKGWDVDTVDTIDAASTKVVFNLDFPGQTEFKTRGLVLGYVQSGKTANFTAVMSKAADVNFRLFIVLSGMTNSLRQQTQERLNKELVALQSPPQWLTWTDEESDIGDVPFDINALLDTNKRHVAVVKKNGPRLRRLLRIIGEVSDSLRARVPVMIIDDECDQASVNASRARGQRTTINRLLLDIVNELPKVAYVGYTATPYANILIDPAERDLYPKDFIISLPRPDAYFGAERLFGRDLVDADPVTPDGEGLDMIRLVDDTEAAGLRPASRADKDTFLLQVTPSLRGAILYYWLATAAREVRGDQAEHTTMLIHTTVYADAHRNAIPQLAAFRAEIADQLRRGDTQLASELQALWENESAAVDSRQFGLEPVSFDSIRRCLSGVIDDTKIVYENSLSDERLEYSEPGQRYIVVGGNVLARGLTIEGLLSSLFLRTSSQYDSLMQMGRWFGYRNNYEDLPRIWMTADMAQYFKDMATVEAEMRYDIETYDREKLTPEDFAVRIRCHPALAITSRNKMSDAVSREVSFNGRHVQTRKFRHRDTEWLTSNWAAGAALINAAGKQSTGRAGKPLFYNVTYTRIVEFLNRYRIHEAHADMATERLTDYIARNVQRTGHHLASWNVGVITGNEAPSETPLGQLGSISTVKRSQLKISDAYNADIKALTTRSDAVTDFPDDYNLDDKRWADLARDRMAVVEGSRPLLLLYPVNWNSEPAPIRGNSSRKPLNAVQDVLGMAIFFPRLDHDEPVAYVSAPIDPSNFEDAEYQEEQIDE